MCSVPTLKSMEPLPPSHATVNTIIIIAFIAIVTTTATTMKIKVMKLLIIKPVSSSDAEEDGNHYQ